jgi:hypothetical protein
MDFKIFTDIMNTAVSGFPLYLVVMGLVEILKKAKWFSGNALIAASVVMGTIVGGLYYGVQNVPLEYNITFWVSLVVYGVTVGLVASGLYDTAKSIIKSASVKALVDFTDNAPLIPPVPVEKITKKVSSK